MKSLDVRKQIWSKKRKKEERLQKLGKIWENIRLLNLKDYVFLTNERGYENYSKLLKVRKQFWGEKMKKEKKFRKEGKFYKKTFLM